MLAANRQIGAFRNEAAFAPGKMVHHNVKSVHANVNLARLTTRENIMRRFLTAFGALSFLLLNLAASARAADVRSYVVSWFYLASALQAEETDCPSGFNPLAEENFRQWLKDQGRTPKDIEGLMEDFPN